MREISIDFTQKIPRPSSEIWGLVGEHKATLLKCTLDESFVYCDFINAEFELVQGKRVVIENIEVEWTAAQIYITQQISKSYRVALQLTGYQREPLSDEIKEIAKTKKVYGRFGESVMGTQIETEEDASFAEQAFIKAQHAYELANHDNKKTLDSLYREDMENMFILNHLGAHYLSCGGAYLRYCSDGSVIRQTETVTENGKTYLRLWLDHGPLHFGNVTDFIDVPIANAQDKTSTDDLGFSLNGTGLDLGISDLEKKVNVLREIPIVHTLPETAEEGSLCLYSPANVLTTNDACFYMDWAEFAQPSEEDWSSFIFGNYYLNSSFELVVERGQNGHAYFYFAEYYANRQKITEVTFENGELVPENSKIQTYLNNGTHTEREIESVDKLPTLFPLPKFNSIEITSEETPVPLFYAPYRIMVYHSGNWSEELTNTIDTDGHIHNNVGSLNKLSSELFDGGIILGYPSPYLKFNGKNLRFCEDGYVLGKPTETEKDGRKYITAEVISEQTNLNMSFDGTTPITKLVIGTLDIPTDTVSLSDFTSAIATIDNHSHANKLVLDSLTEDDIRYWNSIDNHSHNNYSLLQSITGNDVVDWKSMVVKVSTNDNGKFLKVVDGKWAAVKVDFAAIYTGSGFPSNDIGNDGDLYIQTE